jgi:TolB-like protein/DNA-binding winged helix-turn-helix (wHTH) protein
MPLCAKSVRFGIFEVELASGELHKDGLRIKLQGQPIQVLTALLEHPGEVVTRDELRQRLWPSDTFVDFEHNLNSAVKRLREALGDSADHPRFVETLPRHGYRFIYPVQPTDRAAMVGVWDDSQLLSKRERSSPVVSKSDNPFTSLAPRVLLGVLFVLLLAGGIMAYLRTRTRTTIDSVAVLPFANVSGDPNTEYLSDGLTESLIGSLTRVPELKVKSRYSAFRYKGKLVEIPKIGRELEVSALVSGRVLQSGGNVEIRAELTDVEHNNEIWAENYRGKSSDVVLLQQQIAGDLAEKLRSELSSSQKQQITTQGTRNPEAYGLYVKGRYYWNKRTSQDISIAIACFNEAISKDPKYAQAYSGLADAYAVLAAYGGTDSPTEIAAKSNAAARKALELNPNLARVHTVLANNANEYYWKFAEGEAEYKRALELDPNDAITHAWYATDLAYIGNREQEAIAEALLAAQLDPLEPIITDLLGGVYISTRHYDEALAVCNKLSQGNPTFAPVHKDCLAPAYWAKRMYPQVIQEWKLYGQLSGDAREAAFASAVEQGFQAAGWKGALTKGIDARRAQRNVAFFSPYSIAQLYADLGRYEEAFKWLNTAYQERDWSLEEIRTDFLLDPLRSDPFFQALARRMNFPQ